MQQLGIPGNKVFEPLQKLHLPQQLWLEEKVKGVNTSSSQVPGPSPSQDPPQTPDRAQTRSRPLLPQDTPGTKTHSNVSDNSKADYSVYVIKDQNQFVVAVLVETKLTSNTKFPHALAQVRPNRIVWGWGVSSLLTCRSLATI